MIHESRNRDSRDDGLKGPAELVEAFKKLKEQSERLYPQIRVHLVNELMRAAQGYSSKSGLLTFDFLCLSLTTGDPERIAKISGGNYRISRRGVSFSENGKKKQIPFNADLAGMLRFQELPWKTSLEYMLQLSGAVYQGIKNKVIEHELKRQGVISVLADDYLKSPTNVESITLPESPSALIESGSGENMGIVLERFLGGLKSPASVPTDQMHHLLFTEDGVYLFPSMEASPLFAEYTKEFSAEVKKSAVDFRRYKSDMGLAGRASIMDLLRNDFLFLLQDAIREVQQSIPETRLPLVEIRALEIGDEYGMPVLVKGFSYANNVASLSPFTLEELETLDAFLKCGKDTVARAITGVHKACWRQTGRTLDDKVVVSTTYSLLARGMTFVESGELEALLYSLSGSRASFFEGVPSRRPFDFQPEPDLLRALSLSFDSIASAAIFNLGRKNFMRLDADAILTYRDICQKETNEKLRTFAAFGHPSDNVRLGLAANDFGFSSVEYQSAINQSRAPNLDERRLGFLKAAYSGRLYPKTP